MKRKGLLMLLLISLLCACNKEGENMNTSSLSRDPIVTTQQNVYDVNNMLSITNGELPYRLYIPENYSENYDYPVFVFLHGAGERGKDNSLQLFHVIQDLFNDLSSPIYQSFVIVPQCPQYQQWVDTPWEKGNYSVDNVPESNEIKVVLNLIEDLKDFYTINEKRIYAMGISMGGFGVWDLLMRHGEIFAAAIPVCGGADPSYASKLVNKPIYTFHGDQDSAVPVDGTREMVNALKEAGSSLIQYEELVGYEHNVWTYAANKEGLIDWLFQQKL